MKRMANEVKQSPTSPENIVVEGQEVVGAVQRDGQDFLERNQKTIVGVVAALILIAASIFFYRKFIQEPAQAEASEQLWKAQQMFERDSFSVALTNPAPGYMGFLDIAEEYSSTPAGNLAKYYAGISYLQLGQYDAAIDYLDSFDDDGSILPATKAGALGDAHAQKGDLAQAESYYATAVSESGDNSLLAPYFMKKLGMLKERQGDKAGAKDLYTKIQQDFPLSTEAQDIEKFILRAS